MSLKLITPLRASIGLLVASVLLIGSYCAPPPAAIYNSLKNGAHLKQCSVPILFGFSKRTPEKIKSNALDAISYWNKEYGGELFFNMGDFDTKANVSGEYGAIVIIDTVPEEEYEKYFNKDKAIGRVLYSKYPSKDGCVRVHLVVKAKLLNDEFTETGVEGVIRHELGHVLGLGHNDYDSEGLMHGSANPKSNRLKDMSDLERKAFKLYYSK